MTRKRNPEHYPKTLDGRRLVPIDSRNNPVPMGGAGITGWVYHPDDLPTHGGMRAPEVEPTPEPAIKVVIVPQPANTEGASCRN